MNVEAMQRFFRECRHKMLGIVRKAAGELEVGDVENTAYELAVEIQTKRERAFDFDDEDDRSHLLARLWNKLVKFADTKLRYAVSLDEDPNEERPTQATMIARTVSAPETSDPSVLLERAQEEEEAEERLRAHYSELVAYLLLFRRFDTRKALASFLTITTGGLRYRVHRAECRAEHAALFDGVEAIDPNFTPTPIKGRSPPSAHCRDGKQWEWAF